MTSTQNGQTPEPAEAAPYLIPLNAVFDDDFLELLIPVMSNNTVAELAGAVAQHAEGVRVPARDAGIAPLDHVRVDYAS
jgi:toluene monooxygenase system protein B